MSIFTRFCDIIHSNVNALIEKAEDPEKLIQSMLSEIEDTLVDLKSSCASVIADKKFIERKRERLESEIRRWNERAALAVSKNREDLAREALREKLRLEAIGNSLTSEIDHHIDIISKYRGDIAQLEEKLRAIREKRQMMVLRHKRARQAIRSRSEIRKMESYEENIKFNELENRITRMEAEADLVLCSGNPTLEERFDAMATEDQLEKELERLKKKAMPDGEENRTSLRQSTSYQSNQ